MGLAKRVRGDLAFGRVGACPLFRDVAPLLPRDHLPFPGKDVEGDVNVGGVDPALTTGRPICDDISNF